MSGDVVAGRGNADVVGPAGVIGICLCVGGNADMGAVLAFTVPVDVHEDAAKY